MVRNLSFISFFLVTRQKHFQSMMYQECLCSKPVDLQPLMKKKDQPSLKV